MKRRTFGVIILLVALSACASVQHYGGAGGYVVASEDFSMKLPPFYTVRVAKGGRAEVIGTTPCASGQCRLVQLPDPVSAGVRFVIDNNGALTGSAVNAFGAKMGLTYSPKPASVRLVSDGSIAPNGSAMSDVSSPQAVLGVTVKEDRFTKSTKIQMNSLEPKRLGRPELSGSVSIKDGQAQLSMLSILVSGSDWQYLSCHSINWLIDGEPVEMPQPRHDGEAIRGGVIEVMSLTNLPVTAFAQIGGAASVEYRICNDEFEMSKLDRDGFAELARRVSAVLPREHSATPSP